MLANTPDLSVEGLNFYIVQPNHGMWWHALELAREEYVRKGVLVTPPADMAISRVCCTDEGGAVAGTVGMRYANFACATEFPDHFGGCVRGETAVELTQLAVSASFRRSLSLTMRMLKLAFERASSRATKVIFVARPAHVSFYLKVGFKEVTRVDRTGKHPAVFMAASIEDVRVRIPAEGLRPMHAASGPQADPAVVLPCT